MGKLSVNLKTFSQVVREFVGALRKKRTYNIFENWYCLFGILWGMPVPVVTIGIALHSRALAITLPNITRIIISDPLHIFFLLHPLFFGIVFGAMGTVRYNKEHKIQELNRLKSNFLSMISHELRTPLTTIKGYITFLMTEKAGAINKTQEECLGISAETADLLDRMIEDLLDLSKIESGEFKVNLTATDITKIMDKAILSRQLFADNQEVILENNLPRDLPLIRADRERILQVMINILENAIKFNKRGGKVAIAAAGRPSAKITFCISDTGIGIPNDKLARIFDKFYQVDSSEKRRYKGCGLGLAISKRIVELHNGRIWAESEVGVGSKFFLELMTTPS